MNRKNTLAFVFDTPRYVVILGMVAYRHNRVMFPGYVLGKSTETFKPVNTGQTPAPASEGFSFSSTIGAST